MTNLSCSRALRGSIVRADSDRVTVEWDTDALAHVSIASEIPREDVIVEVCDDERLLAVCSCLLFIALIRAAHSATCFRLSSVNTGMMIMQPQ